MKTTIEEINGKLCTVVWHNGFDRNSIWNWKEYISNYDGMCEYLDCGHQMACTALPALPKHPKPEDARLLYRYMAEGIEIMLKSSAGYQLADVVIADEDLAYAWEVAHAINSETGERVEVAING